ncbi:MAG: lysostaphin resistance A-like protein [Candidatus Helarchaeota archaeon]
MNKDLDINNNLLLSWEDSLIIWGILFIVQIFVFSIITELLLGITGWNFNIVSLILGMYGNPMGLWLGVFITEIGTLLISIFYLKIRRKKNLKLKKFIKIENFNSYNIYTALFFVPVIFLTGILISYIQSFFYFDPQGFFIYNTVFTPKNVIQLVIWIIIMLLLVGPSEEIVFRRIIQRGFQNTFKRRGTHKLVPVIISSLLFSVYHVDFSKFIPIFFMGFILGYLYLITDSSLVCGLSHGVYDAVSIIIMFIF